MAAHGNRRLSADLCKYQKIGFDTSVIIYHLEDIAPYSALTEEALSLLGYGKISVILSTISVTELLTKPFSKGKLTQVQVCERFLQQLPHTRIEPVDYDIAKKAARLRGDYGLKTPDALLLSTALQRGAGAFLTNDKQLSQAHLKRENIKVLLLEDYLS